MGEDDMRFMLTDETLVSDHQRWREAVICPTPKNGKHKPQVDR